MPHECSYYECPLASRDLYEILLALAESIPGAVDRIHEPFERQERQFALKNADASALKQEIGLDGYYFHRLVDAGIRTVRDIRNASDDELLKVDGIGVASLRKLREATKEPG